MLSTVGPTFTMAELVSATAVGPSTVRYYIATGLIPPGIALAPNRHLYDERHVESLRLIMLLKERRGLNLDQIRKILPELLELPADGAFRPEMWEQLVEARVRTSEPSAPSARLLRSGIDLFTRHGYAEVRVDDVCQAAGIAKGSFYRHFCSKEELFFAAAREVGEQIVERFTAYFLKAGPSGTEDRIEALVKALEPNLALVLDLTALAAQRRPGHARVANEVFERLHRATRAPVEAAPGGPMEEVLERALVVAIRRCVLLRFGPLTE